MGSPLRLTLSGLDAGDMAEALWRAARDDVEATEQALSRFRETSELTALNRALGRIVPVSPRLYAAVAASERARRVTGGAFDPRIHDDLERLGERGAAIGTDETDLAAAQWSRHGFVDRPIAVRAPRDRSVRIDRRIDLGGIGKGLALRWAGRRLRQLLREARPAPLPGFLLEAGGDIVCEGQAPEGGPWQIAIEDPAGRGPLAVAILVDGAIMTSSTAVRAWRAPDGRPVHHLLDPRTGEPSGTGLRAVTVAGPDPAWSEVRTKALFLAGARGIGPVARGAGLAAWWVAEDGRLSMTPAARLATAWVRDEAA